MGKIRILNDFQDVYKKKGSLIACLLAFCCSKSLQITQFFIRAIWEFSQVIATQDRLLTESEILKQINEDKGRCVFFFNFQFLFRFILDLIFLGSTEFSKITSSVFSSEVTYILLHYFILRSMIYFIF